jgi:anti-sigma B factor antagonist
MKYSVNKKEEYTIFKLQEDKLDSTIAPGLKSEFITLNAEGVKNLILDMSDVRYTDSSGLSSLLVGNRIFSEESGIFIMVALSEHVMKLIKISQLNNVLNIVATLEEAVDAVFLHEIESGLNKEEEE